MYVIFLRCTNHVLKNKGRRSSRILFPTDDSQQAKDAEEASGSQRSGVKRRREGDGSPVPKRVAKRKHRPATVNRQEDTEGNSQQDTAVRNSGNEEREEADGGEEGVVEQKSRWVRNLVRESGKSKEEVLAALYEFSGMVDVARDYLVFGAGS